MIHLDFDQDQENSLDLLMKFGEEMHQPFSSTSDSYSYSSNSQDKICVTSTSAILQTTLCFKAINREEQITVVKMNEAIQSQQAKLQQLWLYVQNIPKVQSNQQNQQRLKKELDVEMYLHNKK